MTGQDRLAFNLVPIARAEVRNEMTRAPPGSGQFNLDSRWTLESLYSLIPQLGYTGDRLLRSGSYVVYDLFRGFHICLRVGLEDAFARS